MLLMPCDGAINLGDLICKLPRVED